MLGVTGAGSVSRDIRRQHARMIRQRFSFVSVAAMVFAAAFVTLTMIRHDGGGLAGKQGFPLAWYWWTDVSFNDSRSHGYLWGGLIADVLIWFAVIVGFGLLVERIS